MTRVYFCHPSNNPTAIHPQPLSVPQTQKSLEPIPAKPKSPPPPSPPPQPPFDPAPDANAPAPDQAAADAHPPALRHPRGLPVAIRRSIQSRTKSLKPRIPPGVAADLHHPASSAAPPCRLHPHRLRRRRHRRCIDPPLPPSECARPTHQHQSQPQNQNRCPLPQRNQPQRRRSRHRGDSLLHRPTATTQPVTASAAIAAKPLPQSKQSPPPRQTRRQTLLRSSLTSS